MPKELKIIIIIAVLIFNPLSINSENFSGAVDYSSDDEYYMFCHTEIPSGETWTLAHDLLDEIIFEINEIQKLSDQMYVLQNEMNELASECTLDSPNCQTNCVLVCGKESCYCSSRACSGSPCSFKKEIQEHYSSIRSKEQQIQVHRQNIDDMLNKQDVDLCEGINEKIDLNSDIRLDVKKVGNREVVYNETEKCKNNVDSKEGSASWRWLTRREYIKRKLDFTRMYFMGCHAFMDYDDSLTEEDASEIEMLLSCYETLAFVEDMDLNSKTFTEEDGRKLYICTDPHNWFCCQ